MQYPVSCNKDCGGGCPLTAVVEDGIITSIKDSDRRDRWMNGCIRGYRAHRLTYHPDRLKTPLIKSKSTGRLLSAGWSEALDFTAQRLTEIKERYGPAAVMRLGGSGACRGALHNTSRLARRFLSLYGGFTELTGSYSSAAVTFVTPFVYGTVNAAADAAAFSRSECIILLGANIADLRFGPELMNRLLDARRRGIKIIVIDPRKTATVSSLDAEWIKIKPGTDAAFLAGVIFDLCETGGIDEAYIQRYCTGFEAFKDWLYESPRKTPEWAAVICGIPAGRIRYIADIYRKHKPAALIPGLSIQRNLGGEDSARMAMVLQSVTGNTGIAGGSSGSNIWGPMPHPRCGRISETPACPAPPKKRFLPVYIWADAILDKDGSIPIKAAYCCGGNYISQGADIHKSIRAFKELEFSVTHDFFLTPTAELSDVVFPVADFLERSDIIFPEGNFLLYSAQAVSPPEAVKTDYEIFSLLAERLGFKDLFTEGRAEGDWLDYFLQNSEIPDVKEFRKTGIYFGKDRARVALSEFIEDPEGNPLKTPSGKIEISSESYAATGASPFPIYTEYRPPGKFQLITPHARTRINSQYSNVYEGPDRLFMNSTDAGELNIIDGQLVRICGENGENGENGEIRIRVSLTDDIMSGVVSLDAGRWPEFEGKTEIAGSANVVTSTEPTRPSGGARTNSTFVDVKQT